MLNLPLHLQKYIVEQNYEKYTWQDHAVWRFILRQLKSFLGKNAHHSYLEGLVKTGIEIEKIPRIEDVSKKLEAFGWRALPVSGFIPPAAFMELQSLGVLPIASDMRSIEHLLYTPAPDIVHEAAGHAPIIADPEYAAYLTEYAQVAKKALISREDLAVYQAIRELSDIKENPNSTPAEISNAESRLVQVVSSVSFISEATELSRMNWWTAEYGLVGNISNPKIFGAGLLSSVGESKWCLSDKVKKIPLTLDCIKYSYDITEPQPQLFVAESFSHLSTVLKELAETMAFKTGGVSALEKAKKTKTVNTVELDSGIQLSGVLEDYILDQRQELAYLQFSGPCQLSVSEKQISGHGSDYHQLGYGTPLGKLKNFAFKDLVVGQKYDLEYASGVKLSGTLLRVFPATKNSFVLSFENATCTYLDKVLFRPEWGLYDVITGTEVTSVYSGPADRVSFGLTEDFVAPRVTPPMYSEKQRMIFKFYHDVRLARESSMEVADLNKMFLLIKAEAPNEWLLFVELLEILNRKNLKKSTLTEEVLNYLNEMGKRFPNQKELIESGIELSNEEY